MWRQSAFLQCTLPERNECRGRVSSAHTAVQGLLVPWFWALEQRHGLEGSVIEQCSGFWTHTQPLYFVMSKTAQWLHHVANPPPSDIPKLLFTKIYFLPCCPALSRAALWKLLSLAPTWRLAMLSVPHILGHGRSPMPPPPSLSLAWKY